MATAIASTAPAGAANGSAVEVDGSVEGPVAGAFDGALATDRTATTLPDASRPVSKHATTARPGSLNENPDPNPSVTWRLGWMNRSRDAAPTALTSPQAGDGSETSSNAGPLVVTV